MSATSHPIASNTAKPPKHLLPEERVFFRDRLRDARYAALADAEGFQQMCFAIEALAKRLKPDGNGLGSRRAVLHSLARQSKLLPDAGESARAIKTFDALFLAIKEARNDVMHTGAYARHVAADAVTLCLVLEDALMMEKKSNEEVKRLTAGDFMVSTPVVVHPWQTVEHARRLMLLNSFSYLPIFLNGKWWLISDIAVAQYLRPHWPAKDRLLKTLTEAKKDGLKLTRSEPVCHDKLVVNLLFQPKKPGLWLVVNSKSNVGKDQQLGQLVGVLSPFELM